MNSKFIKVLIVINGILIPVFIIILLGLMLKDFLKTTTSRADDISLSDDSQMSITYTAPEKIPNSENYFVAKYEVETFHGVQIETEVELGNVPDNTVNLVFLNQDFEKIGTLLETDASIRRLYIADRFTEDEERQKLIKHMIFSIATEDSNQDGQIDLRDDHYLYISDLNGKQLHKVLDKKVKAFQLIEDFTQLLITYVTDQEKEVIGIYDIEKRVFEKKVTLNFWIKRLKKSISES